jgi:thiamine pyrophosphate-dependent acetolactate synthase large subunit-like protein
MSPVSHPAPESVERPQPGAPANALCGSDVLADAIRDLGIEYLTVNPGSSFRGLHDSIVNYLGNAKPQVLLCLHEEHAVAIAHGYAKITARPMAAAVHSNVGLMHASMAIYNAYCDRVPVLVIGATGPVDADKRRAWIDWIHTSQDQGALIRNYVKWDDQPNSVMAARESILRAGWLAGIAPMAPVYVNFDTEIQEQMLTEPLRLVDAKRFLPPVAIGADRDQCRRAAALLKKAARPLILIGRVGRSKEAWEKRVRLAEAVGARVVTSRQAGASFPTDHPLHVSSMTSISGQPGLPGKEAVQAIAESDLIVSLDWLDLAGVLKYAFGDKELPKVIQASNDYQLHNGWSMEYFGLPAADEFLATTPDAAVGEMLQFLPTSAATAPQAAAAAPAPRMEGPAIRLPHLVHALRAACGGRAVSLLKAPILWSNAMWPLRDPLDYVGSEGGGGIGAGPGIAVGGALALKGSGRLPVCITGDGDFVMGVTALWTAARYRIPLLFIVTNNQSFFNDEVHQRVMAQRRGRPVENQRIGIEMNDPALDLVKLAEGQGAVGFGPVTAPADLEGVFAKAIAAVEQGAVAVVDVRTPPDRS